MKLIITNDDGIEAPGIAALTEAAAELGQAIVVAPAFEQSGVGHQVTTSAPLQVEQLEENRYQVHGTPADCARVGLTWIAPDADWLLSGINAGANLGSDLYHSGTVAAAREAAILGYPGLALSQYIARDHDLEWALSVHHAGWLLRTLTEKKPQPWEYLNVNLPHPLSRELRPALRFCRQDRHPHRFRYVEEPEGLRYNRDFHDRPRDPGLDVDICFSGAVSVTRLRVGGWHGPDGGE